MSPRVCLIAGALFGLLAVALGAFGAHGLQSAIKKWELSPEDQQRRLENWETAVRYQMYHALALLAVGALMNSRTAPSGAIAGGSFLIGVLLFSGCLFAYVLTGAKPLVHLVPVGGAILIVGWAALVVFVMKQQL